MKKRLLIAILVLCMLAVFLPTASANAPVPDPTVFWLDYRNVPEGAVLSVVTTDGETLYTMTAQTDSGRLTVLDGAEADFYVRLECPDGRQVQSDSIPFESRDYFRFDGETGKLEQGSYLKEESNSTVWILFALAALGLFLALNITIVVEILVGLCFRLKRYYRILLINLITNPVMNLVLLLLTLTSSGSSAYWIVLAVLELLVCGVEFWFYARKYRERKKWVLLLFTLLANALSAAAGILPLWLLMH